MKTYTLDPAGQCVMRNGRPFLTAAPCSGMSHDDVSDALECAVAALNNQGQLSRPGPRGFSVTSLADCRI